MSGWFTACQFGRTRKDSWTSMTISAVRLMTPMVPAGRRTAEGMIGPRSGPIWSPKNLDGNHPTNSHHYELFQTWASVLMVARIGVRTLSPTDRRLSEGDCDA
jgi:hypothetical protein